MGVCFVCLCVESFECLLQRGYFGLGCCLLFGCLCNDALQFIVFLGDLLVEFVQFSPELLLLFLQSVLQLRHQSVFVL